MRFRSSVCADVRRSPGCRSGEDCLTADPDPIARRNQSPARTNAVAPPMAMPEVGMAATYSATTTSGAAAASASAAPSTAAATTASGLRSRIGRAHHQTRNADGHEAIDPEQGSYCQTARQEFARTAVLISGHLIACLKAFHFQLQSVAPFEPLSKVCRSSICSLAQPTKCTTQEQTAPVFVQSSRNVRTAAQCRHRTQCHRNTVT